MRELSQTTFDSSKHTSATMLTNNKLVDPVSLTKNLTWLWGKDTNAFPLSALTEGNGLLKSLTPVAMNDTQYKWSVIGRMKHISAVVGLANGEALGIGSYGSYFDVIMEDNWFIKGYTAYSPDGVHTVYIITDGKRIGVKRYQYTFQLISTNDSTGIDTSNFAPGINWAMGAPIIAGSKSDGSRSNKMFPGELINQFGYHRYSKGITGNVANKVVNIQLDGIDRGGKDVKVDTWIPFEMKLFELDRKLLNETDLWMSRYNRDENGEITTIDPDTGEPIPRGAGIYQQLEAVGNYDTYGTLTLAKFDNTINAIFSNRSDNTPIEIVLYTGRGGAREFSRAVMNDAKQNNYFQALGNQVISKANGFLEYGAYFDRYKTIDGKIITVKISSIFDNGLIAEMQKANGDMIDGLPRDSYTMVFLDHSMNDEGDRNIQIVAEKGREYQIGVYKGMTPLPAQWGLADDIRIASRKDEAYYEVIDTAGVAIKNVTTSFRLERK